MDPKAPFMKKTEVTQLAWHIVSRGQNIHHVVTIADLEERNAFTRQTTRFQIQNLDRSLQKARTSLPANLEMPRQLATVSERMLRVTRWLICFASFSQRVAQHFGIA